MSVTDGILDRLRVLLNIISFN